MSSSNDATVIKLFEDVGFTAAQAKMLMRSHNSVVEVLDRMIDEKVKRIKEDLDCMEEYIQKDIKSIEGDIRDMMGDIENLKSVA